MKANVKIPLLAIVSAGCLGTAVATEPVDPVDEETPDEIPPAQLADPVQPIDPRIPHDTMVTYVNVLVGTDGNAVRVELAESSNRQLFDRRALKLAGLKQYPVRTDNDEPIEYWLMNQRYEVIVRAMSNRVDGLPGDPDARTEPQD